MSNHRRRSSAAVLSALAFAAALSVQPAVAAPPAHARIVLPSAISVDDAAGIVTLPLHRGTAAGKTVWYIVTDSSTADDARSRKANLAPLLANLGQGCAGCVRDAVEINGAIAFPGAPNFAPKRGYVASTTGFPPTSAAPGATADARYTPFVRIGNAVVNAPIVATGEGPFDVTTHANTQDRVVAIDTAKRTVTLALAKGFFNGKRVDYLSTEASDAGAAAIERATYVPALAAQAGTVPIDVVANGTNQGLGFVALHGNLALDATLANAATLGSAMNVLSTFPVGPSAAAYSPLWDVDVVAWKPAVLAAHGDHVVTSLDAIAAAAADVTGADGKAIGRAGFVVNCPVVAYVD